MDLSEDFLLAASAPTTQPRPTMDGTNDDDNNNPPSGYYVQRFDYRRDTGLPASGIVVIPNNRVGDFRNYLLYTTLHHSCLKVHVYSFGIDARPPEEQDMFLQALQTAQCLVFADGKRAVVRAKDLAKLHHVLCTTKPLWDEHSILEVFMRNRWAGQRLVTGNTFGTWADQVAGEMTGFCFSKFCWRMIRDDPRLSPPEDRQVVFRKDRFEDTEISAMSVGERVMEPEEEDDDL